MKRVFLILLASSAPALYSLEAVMMLGLGYSYDYESSDSLFSGINAVTKTKQFDVPAYAQVYFLEHIGIFFRYSGSIWDPLEFSVKTEAAGNSPVCEFLFPQRMLFGPVFKMKILNNVQVYGGLGFAWQYVQYYIHSADNDRVYGYWRVSSDIEQYGAGTDIGAFVDLLTLFKGRLGLGFAIGVSSSVYFATYEKLSVGRQSFPSYITSDFDGKKQNSFAFNLSPYAGVTAHVKF